MIILDFFLLCFLIFLLYIKKEETVKEKTEETEEVEEVVCKKIEEIKYKKKINIIENLEIIKNNNKLPIKLNDYNIEVDRPVFSCSNYKNDKNIDLNNINEELVNIAYDNIVNDNRIQNLNYENICFYNCNDNHYNIKNNDNYGYSDFMTYKK
jgi:hypothetical protein